MRGPWIVSFKQPDSNGVVREWFWTGSLQQAQDDERGLWSLARQIATWFYNEGDAVACALLTNARVVRLRTAKVALADLTKKR